MDKSTENALVKALTVNQLNHIFVKATHPTGLHSETNASCCEIHALARLNRRLHLQESFYAAMPYQDYDQFSSQLSSCQKLGNQ